ncbi:hypothetical protein SS50377_22938 [Spironucleus salmonicida]|nr:hypothetical protein SS50377_22938 [Spironucleus salmonicida]
MLAQIGSISNLNLIMLWTPFIRHPFIQLRPPFMILYICDNISSTVGTGQLVCRRCPRWSPNLQYLLRIEPDSRCGSADSLIASQSRPNWSTAVSRSCVSYAVQQWALCVISWSEYQNIIANSCPTQ